MVEHVSGGAYVCLSVSKTSAVQAKQSPIRSGFDMHVRYVLKIPSGAKKGIEMARGVLLGFEQGDVVLAPALPQIRLGQIACPDWI